LLVALTAFGCGSNRSPTAEPRIGDTRATVAYVYDGDTLRTTDDRRIRIVQIDAPEFETDCYGRAARRALLRLASPGTHVVLQADPELDPADRYGRLLRYVVANGRDVGLQLVAAGAAMPYFFRGDRGRHADELLRAARRARAHRLGLWAACPKAKLRPAIGSVTGPS
jgi:endonuclease YncB( thermonuclease family)